MSAIIVLPIVIPVAGVVWPIVATAAAAAAVSMGFAAVGQRVEAQTGTTVDLNLSTAEQVAQDVALGEELVFTKDDVQVRIGRDNRGKMYVKVHGDSQTKAELAALGEEFCQRIAQQYAYHRLITELKQRNFNVVDQTVETDGTVRVKVRVYQG